MVNDILEKEPKRVWYYFNEICKIPRGSDNEAGIRKFIVNFADKLKLKHKTDSIGNLVVYKDATEKYKSAKTLVFQGHLDMVCEAAPGVKHDFTKDPIIPIIEGDWLTTGGKTTLGADNGIAIAACLAFLEDKNIEHGPIECLFTTCEERGLKGAMELDTKMLKGRTLVNLDSEEDGMIFVGCAGACDSIVEIPVTFVPVDKNIDGLSIVLNGLSGGHSGLVIHEQRGNAIKLLGRILYEVRKNFPIVLCFINGGTKRNVIPNVATATIACKKDEKGKITAIIKGISEKISNEYKTVEPNFKVDIKNIEVKKSFAIEQSDKIISFVNVAPNGVVRMGYDMPDLVQTSTNFAVIQTKDNLVYIHYMSRSCCKSDIDAVKSTISACARLVGVESVDNGEYPGWQPNLNSPILNLTKKIYSQLFNEEPNIKAIHAGLECGLIGEKVGGMDMVSFGPELPAVHSVNEKLHIGSVEKMWKLMVRVASDFAKA